MLPIEPPDIYSSLYTRHYGFKKKKKIIKKKKKKKIAPLSFVRVSAHAVNARAAYREIMQLLRGDDYICPRMQER